MATKKSTIDYLLEQIAGSGVVFARKMFGEYAVYCDGKVVALVCNDELFVKPTKVGKTFIGNITEGVPYPGAKAYYLIPGDQWEDTDWLAQLIRISAAELPMSKSKKKNNS